MTVAPQVLKRQVGRFILIVMRGLPVAFLACFASATVAHADAPGGTGEIDGAVLDTVTGAPLFGATVTVVSSGTQETTITDEAGRYTVVRLAPGEYAVQIIYGDAQVKRERVAVTAGAIVEDGEGVLGVVVVVAG